MADDKARAIRRAILEELHRTLQESPGAQRVWQVDRNDPDRLVRMREAEYLRDNRLIRGMIGADGGLALKLTSEGRDYVEAGGFWEVPIPRLGVDTGDRGFIRIAIDEARRSIAEDDRVHPMVGAVAVRDGRVLGTAHRGELGAGEHGEFTLLERKLAAETLADATVYVTLEPCTTRNHPKVSCAARLLERKVARVVIGVIDPDRRISGQGVQMLRTGRIEIAFFPDDLAAEIEELNRHFKRSVLEDEAKREEASRGSSPDPNGPATVHIAISNSTIHGDVIGGTKKS